jgi:hypothetical protein
LLVTGGLVVLAGIFIAAALILATSGTTRTPDHPRPLCLGDARSLNRAIDQGSPLYFANPFGGNGFWLDKEGGRFVALDLVLPGTRDCTVRWRGRVDSYVDCDGRHRRSTALDRFAVTVPVRGTRKGGVLVDLRQRIAAPETGAGAG